MAVVSKRQREVSEVGIGQTGKICSCGRAVTIVRSARIQPVSNSITLVHGRAPRSIAGRDFIQILAPDQPMRGDAKVRKTSRSFESQFTFVGSVVLLNKRCMKTNRYGIG